METKDLNLCELLKGHEGETFFSLLIGECVLSEITTPTDTYPIKLEHSDYSSDGRFESTGVPVVYPTRALYEQYPLDPVAAWTEWQELQKQILMSVTLGAMGDGNTIHKFYQFRTVANRDKCIQEIKAILKKYSVRYNDK